MFLKVTFFNFWAKFGIFCSQLEHTSWLVLTIWLIFIRISLNFLIKVTLLIYVSVQLKSFIFFGSEMLKQKHVWSLGNKSWVLFFLSFITLPLFVLCCFAQVNNGHILVVIHIGMVSQTIKVSINDTPSQVHNSLPHVFLPYSYFAGFSDLFFSLVQVLASFFAKTANKRVLLGIPDDVCEADFVLRVCGRYCRCLCTTVLL